ncbi:MFS transporter [Ramlibacter sp.]|uniref:MFS transporter n=1 Tax=Ramlibacter sp. TaxID=1917967 RepID=UPI002CEE380A|nr:MFS transporter [Ramlibacter sp.]HWI83806.1 MFS transporter [Ramlibacter sp.]
MSENPDPAPVVRRVLAAKALRCLADGFVSLLLPVYLLQLGFGPVQVGLVATGTLLGSGVLTLAVGLQSWRFNFRTWLLASAALMAATGIGFAVVTDFWPLLLIAIVGTLNPSAGDVSVFLPLEQALLAQVVEHRRRTAQMARYSLVGTLAAAVGSLAAALPTLAAGRLGMSETAALQGMFVLYALLALAAGAVYRGLPAAPVADAPAPRGSLQAARKRVYLLAALFSLDAFGGGFVVQSLVALWLYQRFDLAIATAGAIFFWTGVLTAMSYLVAARIADRFGLLNTMVFSHLPSSVCLLLIPFMDTIGPVLVLLFIRSALSQMDVPTRSSYVMSIVPPAERAAAASVTAVPRSLAAAASPMLAGYLLGISPFGWAFIAGGVAKIVYDLLLLGTFRNVRPPEEEATITRKAS